jgi:hypothetical protein
MTPSPSGRFRSRFVSRIYTGPDSRMPFSPRHSDTPEQRREKTLAAERHFHKLGARIRRDRALTGKAGRPQLLETQKIFQKYYVEFKIWDLCFEELWAETGSKPVPPERARVKARFRKYARDYAARQSAACS